MGANEWIPATMIMATVMERMSASRRWRPREESCLDSMSEAGGELGCWKRRWEVERLRRSPAKCKGKKVVRIAMAYRQCGLLVLADSREPFSSSDTLIG